MCRCAGHLYLSIVTWQDPCTTYSFTWHMRPFYFHPHTKKRIHTENNAHTLLDTRHYTILCDAIIKIYYTDLSSVIFFSTTTNNTRTTTVKRNDDTQSQSRSQFINASKKFPAGSMGGEGGKKRGGLMRMSHHIEQLVEETP